MKIKVGTKIYDGDEEPVMVILSDKDKCNIANMPADKTQYCSFPVDANVDEITKWMAK